MRLGAREGIITFFRESHVQTCQAVRNTFPAFLAKNGKKLDEGVFSTGKQARRGSTRYYSMKTYLRFTLK